MAGVWLFGEANLMQGVAAEENHQFLFGKFIIRSFAMQHYTCKFRRGFITIMLSAAFLLTFSSWQNVNAATVCRANAVS